jgi:hypothetical protein
MREYVFAPLALWTAGFGAPGGKGAKISPSSVRRHRNRERCEILVAVNRNEHAWEIVKRRGRS